MLAILRIFKPRQVRAVGRANGANPLSVVVPSPDRRQRFADQIGRRAEAETWLLEHEGVVLLRFP
jgi:O6-methylguanine-DNA--protein-cysteine methyltransferase